jgi:hypothetical protein
MTHAAMEARKSGMELVFILSPILVADLFYDSLSRQSGNGGIPRHRSLMKRMHLSIYSNRVAVALPQRVVIGSPFALVSSIVAL